MDHDIHMAGICMLDESIVKYIYIYHIFVVKLLEYKKTELNGAIQALCRLPSMAKGSLPSATDGKGATWQQLVQPGSTMLDPFGHSAVSWQTAKIC